SCESSSRMSRRSWSTGSVRNASISARRSTNATSWWASSVAVGGASPGARKSGTPSGGSSLHCGNDPKHRGREPMPDLSFPVETADPVPYAATPLLAFKLRITQGAADPPIQTVALRCQIRMEPARRAYSPAEQAGLLDLFGEPHRWNQTLRSLLWTHA